MDKKQLWRRLSLEVRAQIRRYPEHRQLAMSKLANRGPRYVDILTSFPAACLAMAERRGTREQAAEARARIERGRPRNEIAQALDLAPWLKRFAPEDFQAPLPKRLTFKEPVPGLYQMLRRQVPADPKYVPPWLTLLFSLIDRGPADVVPWVLKHPSETMRQLLDLDMETLLPVYVFYSKRPDTLAGSLIADPFRPDMSFYEVSESIRQWMDHVIFWRSIDLSHMADCSVMPTQFRGYEITPLITPEAIRIEARLMDNCLGDYVSSVLKGGSMLFRFEGTEPDERYSVEIRHLEGIPYAWQISGPENNGPTQHAVMILLEWMHVFLDPHKNALPLEYRIKQEVWDELWTPYWEAHGDNRCLPRKPGHEEIAWLVGRIEINERRRRRHQQLRRALRAG